MKLVCPGPLFRMPTHPPPGHAPDPRLFPSYDAYVPPSRDSYSHGEAAAAPSTPESFGDRFSATSDMGYFPVNHPEIAYLPALDGEFNSNSVIGHAASPVIHQLEPLAPAPPLELGYVYAYNVPYNAGQMQQPVSNSIPNGFYDTGLGGIATNGQSPAHLAESMAMLSLQWSQSPGAHQQAPSRRPRRPSRDATA